ncbi:beta-1,3-galactosyltransferase 5-like [Portunus trituberculatus]|uniref:beta-1,3-galactosyltransferase 5-like n=1 Tax=Portunus trituberculatus TaxID=210409 RepID=UPI001E1CD882|nr:beta-1,3-galactosyltransferase 5-like [Portunus trituberculatus]
MLMMGKVLGWWVIRKALLLVGILTVVMLAAGVWRDLQTTVRVHAPSPLNVSPLYPSHMTLLDLPQFSYVINNDVCSTSNVSLVIIVHTHPARRQERDVIRKSMPSQDLKELGMRRVFLLARAEWEDQPHYSKTPQWSIEEENLEHRDIVQGNFKEHYHNLTYKHVMGLQWTTRYCPQAKFVIKMDGDIAGDIYQFRDRLRSRYAERRNLIVGLLQVEARPVRDKASKWYVSETDYPDKFYAPFISGWAYAITADAVRAVVQESSMWPYFWIDDVHITGTLAERAGIKREGINGLFTVHSDHLHCCLDLPGSAGYYCDYLAGPSEGDLDLLGRVLNHARACYIDPCQRRAPNVSVSKTCVRAKPPAGPRPVLGKGHGEIKRVYK